MNGDGLQEPYIFLREYLQHKGIEVNTADLLPEKANGAKNIYISFGIQTNYQKLAARQDVILSGYFAFECPIVEPRMYERLKTAQNYFKRIFTWSDDATLERFVGKKLDYEHFLWPQSFNQVHEDIWKNSDRKFLVMINANKLPRVYYKELYTERMNAVEFFSRTDEIDLYGKGWDKPSIRVGITRVPFTLRRLHYLFQTQWQKLSPKPLLVAARKVYRGSAPSKSVTLGKYTFALCFENSIMKGWITEKLFDCFYAGTIPIYWGAPEITDYVPSNCFIDMRDFSGYAELREFLKSLAPKDIAAFKENASAYLSSDKFTPFKKQTFAKKIEHIIEQDTGIEL
ncbi:MAG: glycosyltransferase family 10 domain-containing protein [Pyrinomonadaceae bacterium]